MIIDQIHDVKDFEKSRTEVETFESIEESTYPQEYDDGGINFLDYLNEKEKNYPGIQAMFRRPRRKNLSILFSQGYYELAKGTNRANGKIYHIFKPHSVIDIENLYQNKASRDMAVDEVK